MKIWQYILIALVGGLFIFSGLIKLNDPMGTQIKLEEYFEVFKTDKTELGLAALASFWEFLEPYSLSLAIFLSVLEVSLGVSLLVGNNRKGTLWSLLAMLVFFSFLTFYSAFFNKVTDCGCFGDFIKLTPWQSFTKDIVLLVMVLALLWSRNTVASNYGWLPYLSSLGSTIGALVLALYSVWYLPMFDFLPYAVGQNVRLNMQPKNPLKYGPEKYIYTNLKTKQDEQLSQDEFMKNWQKYSDSLSYRFKRMDKPLLNPQDQAKANYVAADAAGTNMTDLTLKGDKLWIIIPDVRHAEAKNMGKIAALVQALAKTSLKPIVLTGDSEANYEAFRHQYQIAASYYFVDVKTLKTMIRANPGLIWLSNGLVKQKWGSYDIPSPEQFK